MATTPRGITLLDGSSIVNPIQTPFNAMANELDGALQDLSDDTINSAAYLLGTISERLALTPPRLREGVSWVETDTGKTYSRRGGVWVETTPVVNLGSVKRSTGGPQGGIGATAAELTGISVNVTLPTAAKLRFLANVNTYSSSNADVIQIQVRDNTTILAGFLRPANSSASLPNTNMSNTVTSEADLPAGAHRINVAIARVAGSGVVVSSVDATAFNYLSIDRIG